MIQSNSGVLLWGLMLLMASVNLAQEPQGKDVPPTANPPASVAAFLADKEGTGAHDFPAWNEYKKIVGDTRVSRGVFAELLQADPELCAAVGGDTQQLVDRFKMSVKRLTEATRDPKRRVVENNRIVDLGVTLPQVTAVIFVAANPAVSAQVNEDFAIHTLLASPPIVRRENYGPTPEHVRTWSMPDARLQVIKRLLSRWAERKVDPQLKEALWSIAFRYRLSGLLHLDDALQPLAMEALQNPGFGRAAAANPFMSELLMHAFLTSIELGNKDHVKLLEAFLEQTTDVRGCVDRNAVETPPQVRDLALSAIVQLNGKAPTDYGFTKLDGRRAHVPDVVPAYFFHAVQDRNQGFEQCIKSYQALGLQKAPQFRPGTTFLHVAGKILDSVPTSPDGKVRLELRGGTAQLIEVATGKPIGKTLNARMTLGNYPFDFTCWSFSPDGKYVVTGSRYYLRRSKTETPTNYGRIEVWDAATGEFVERNLKAVGGVSSVKFSADGSPTISFTAENFSIDRS